jgi:hypothetical protein
LKCPSTEHWKFIEQLILSNGEKRKDKVRITRSLLFNSFIPELDDDATKSVSRLLTDKQAVKKLEEDVDQRVAQSYGLHSLEVDGVPATTIVENFLSKW